MADISIVMPRLDAKPWGGRNLSKFGLPLPDGESIGEALVTANDAIITAGFGEGQTLGEVVGRDVIGRLGEHGVAAVCGAPIFPLLVKLIDATENLSIQVHPNDELAAPLGRLGKTEAWHILASEPDCALYLGLREDVSPEEFIEHAHLLDGTSAADLRREQARENETWLIPAGTVHALGAGVMVYEIQQPSDVTYRLDDWGRTDSEGNPREMHLEAGEKSMRPELRPTPIPGIRLDVAGRRELLTACRYFALEKLNLPEMQSIDLGNPGSPNVVTVLSGQLQIGEYELVAGQSAVIWPAAEPVHGTAEAKTVALRAWVPDRVADIIVPARDAGTLDSDIAALGGMTGDFEAVLLRQ